MVAGYSSPLHVLSNPGRKCCRRPKRLPCSSPVSSYPEALRLSPGRAARAGIPTTSAAPTGPREETPSATPPLDMMVHPSLPPPPHPSPHTYPGNGGEQAICCVQAFLVRAHFINLCV